MMVTFISQCEKKALNRTRRVLDSFANRIGDNTWQTVITNDGLSAVKKLLRKTASKNTAVSCFWIRSRSRSELVWVVGNRDKFNGQGVVPVNSTQKNILNSQYENDWKYLPLIKALTAIAALFHDWGKASELFQDKLDPKSENKFKGDPLRHEWISTLFFNAYVSEQTDEEWLARLITGDFNLEKLSLLAKKNIPKPLSDLSIAASVLAWLIVSHHRLPLPGESNTARGMSADTFNDVLGKISSDFGYENGVKDEDYQVLLQQCFSYPKGLPSESRIWRDKLKSHSRELLEKLPELNKAFEDGSLRWVMLLSRLSLMLGDHCYSSQVASKKWIARDKDKAISLLYANTHKDKKTKKVKLNQRLDEHLFEVAKKAINSTRLLPAFENELEPIFDGISKDFRDSVGDYKWQTKAVNEIKKWKKQLPESMQDTRQGFFAVNMASTGCGKTIANPKIIEALSNDGKSMRFTLALGLRTLTLQTGDEYKYKISPDQKDEIAVMIGSKAIMELHERSQELVDSDEHAETGSESREDLIEKSTEYKVSDKELLNSPLAKVFPEDKSLKSMRFIHPPVLVCTIDYMMPATETKRGGKYIVPTLRLMSSDLVIDEIDDFDGLDLVAIGRLIHLAGMLGRKVMISSATITPDLAEGYFNNYREGWKVFCKARNTSYSIGCAWIDEFSTNVENISKHDTQDALNNYRNAHETYIKNRIQKIKQKEKGGGVRRKGEIILCNERHPIQGEIENKQEQYYEKIKNAVTTKHSQHYMLDTITNKKISFGVVRVANITPCINLAEYLINSDWNKDVDVKIMAYHARQVLLLRHEQERHLDTVLSRKEKEGERPKAFENECIKAHIKDSTAKNLIFIVVATPVEEVGRDHDFDWAVIEPSSYRSIIQLSGRVLRHRNKIPTMPNVAIMQYNIKALMNSEDVPAYCHPGYEQKYKSFKLKHHDLTKLVDEDTIAESINAIPRIQKAKRLRQKELLADLEHYSINYYLANYENQDDPRSMQSWLEKYWWLTGIHQDLVKFRSSRPTTQLFRIPISDDPDETEFKFIEKTPRGEVTECSYSIEDNKVVLNSKRIWLERNYATALSVLAKKKKTTIFKTALKYGETRVNTDDTGQQQYTYSDQIGLKMR